MNIIYSKLMELISLNKGIVLGDSNFHEKLFLLQFCVYDSKTRMLIHFVSEASNTKLNTYARIHPCELKSNIDPDGELIYEYRSKTGEDTMDQACWLGAHLTWAMFKIGVISADKEREYCGVFGAVSRSA
jgi:hypothetical protein